MLVYGAVRSSSPLLLFNNLVRPPRFLRPSEGATLSADVGMEDEDSASLSADALDETACFPADLGTSGYDNVPTETQGVGHKRSGSMLSAQFNFNQPFEPFQRTWLHPRWC